MKFLITLILALTVAFISWPYYHVYKLDSVLGSEDLAQLAPLVDLEQIQDQVQARVSGQIDQASGGQQTDDSLVGWLQSNVKELAGMAVDQAITLEWVHAALRQVAREHSQASPPYFMSAVDYAFFESPDSFVIRLGAVDDKPGYVRMTLASGRWLVTDIVE